MKENQKYYVMIVNLLSFNQERLREIYYLLVGFLGD
jgi:hypothetical protein